MDLLEPDGDEDEDEVDAVLDAAARGPEPDLFDIAGSRTGFGQPAWLASHPPAAETAEESG